MAVEFAECQGQIELAVEIVTAACWNPRDRQTQMVPVGRAAVPIGGGSE